MKLPAAVLIVLAFFCFAVPRSFSAAPAVRGDANFAASGSIEDLTYQEPTSNQGERPGFFAAVVRVIFSLLVVFGCIMGAAYGFKKYNLARAGGSAAPGRSPAAALAGSVYLGPKKQVCLVEVMGRTLVLGVTDSSISLLTEINGPAAGGAIAASGVMPEAAPAEEPVKVRPARKQPAPGAKRQPAPRPAAPAVVPGPQPDSSFLAQYSKIAEKFK